MSAITAKASRKMKKYAVLTREPRCFLGSFDFSWEQRKFEEIAVRSSVICSDDTLPRVEYEDIVSGTGRLNKDIYAKQSSKSGIVFHQGDVLYGKLRPYLQNWLLPTFDGLAVGDFWVLQPQNADSSFLYRLIQSRQFDEVANQSTGTKMPRADWKLVSKTVFSIPSNISEQAAIGTYFTALDSLITLHQRQHFLHSTPDISLSVRLIHPFYTSSWEQRKLNEVVNVYDGVHQTPDYKDSGVMFLSVENISTLKSEKYISEEAFQRDYKVYPQKGDILMTRIGDVGTPNVVEATEKVAFYVSLALLKPTKINSYFLCNSIQSPLFQKGLKDRTLVTAIPQKINKDEIGKVNIILPTSSQEQQLIGDYFRNLDNLITLHQRKGKAAVSGCSNDANNSKGVCCKARDFGYKCHKKDEPNRFDA